MEPLVAGGLVLGLTVLSLTFVGVCNAIAARLYSRFFESKPAAEIEPRDLPRYDADLRRSA